MLTQWHLPPPLTSIVKSLLFTHAHSSPLSLAARLHWCCANRSRYINNGWTFSRQTLYVKTSASLAPFWWQFLGVIPKKESPRLCRHTLNCKTPQGAVDPKGVEMYLRLSALILGPTFTSTNSGAAHGPRLFWLVMSVPPWHKNILNVTFSFTSWVANRHIKYSINSFRMRRPQSNLKRNMYHMSNILVLSLKFFTYLKCAALNNTNFVQNPKT